MYIEQLYTGCLAEAAYYIESEGEAAIIDPIRETTPYIRMAEGRGATIKYIFETHFHADFISGHIDLARETGATIVYGPNAKPNYPVLVATDGQLFKIGKITIKVLHTPGHTPESSCYLLVDEQGKDHALFSGDTLFVGDVGRPDLAVKVEPPTTTADLAGWLYDSLHNKVMTLADEVILYPGHGPGSSCGKSIGKDTVSTIGAQRASNYAVQPMSREDFIKVVTDGLLPPPAYFFKDAAINKAGYDSIDTVLEKNTRPLTLAEMDAVIQNGGLVLDSRLGTIFTQGFIPGSVNIGSDGFFAIWTGTLVDIHQTLVVVAEPGMEAETILRLSRVGYENVAGYLEGGFETWKKAGRPVETVTNMSPEEMASAMLAPNTLVLDVRRISEFESGHVKGAANLPLDNINSRLGELDKSKNYLVHCAGGYRSVIFSSFMKQAGFQNFKNVTGGFAAISKAGVPMETGPVPVTA